MTSTKYINGGVQSQLIENYYQFLKENSYKFSENGTFEKLMPEMNGNRESCSYDNMLDFCSDAAMKLHNRQSFYTMDLADILLKIQMWKEKLPNVELHYAVKANSDPVLLQMLAIMGLSFDCASEGEIREVLKTGASPRNIIFAHTIKTEDEIRYASKIGVDLTTFDNEVELMKIYKIFPNARLLIRLSPSVVKCSFDLSNKFGCTLEEGKQLLAIAKQLRMNVVGVCFHVGALCKDPNSYASAIRDCRTLFDAADAMGFEFSVLDIGGGFSGMKGTEDLFDEITSTIHEALEKYFSNKCLRIIAEPGCYIVVSALQLVCTVVGKKSLPNEKEGNRMQRIYFVNNGIYGSFFQDFEFYGVKVKPMIAEHDLKRRTKYRSKIFGQTCCSEDIISNSVVLPDMLVGEFLVWESMGAYTRGVCSTFCGMPLPNTKYIFQQNNRLQMNWIANYNRISYFIKKHATFIGCTEEDI